MRNKPSGRSPVKSVPLLIAALFIFTSFSDPLPGGSLDPRDIPKFQDPLLIPPVQPNKWRSHQATRYDIEARQFKQQVLPAAFPQTTVWGYGTSTCQGQTFHYPAYTMEVKRNERVQVLWINNLVDDCKKFLPHLFAVDQTLHWANPPGPPDMEGMDPAPYRGPVPLVTHVHGAHVADNSDGYPQAWFLPTAWNIPPGFFKFGTNYTSIANVGQGKALYEYSNDQRPTTLWFHDHALGLTRLNVYAGLAGFWLIRDAFEKSLNLPGPAPRLNDPPGTKYYELPILIQDRSFNTDGSLFYPKDRAFFDGITDVFPATDIPPIWNPEFFGNSIVVNGNTWPFQNVDQHRYRLRLLNGCNSRTLILVFQLPGGDSLKVWQIGNDGGFLPAPLAVKAIRLGPAERVDVIADFGKVCAGTSIILKNFGPDEPFQGEAAMQAPSDEGTTGLVMQFRVRKSNVCDNSVDPSRRGALKLERLDSLTGAKRVRDLTLNEIANATFDVPIRALLGTADAGPLRWGEPITETPRDGDTETWRIINLTEDAHPIHLHLVQFQIIGRIPIDATAYGMAQQAYLDGAGPKPVVDDYFTGPMVPSFPFEKNRKDTFITPPGYVSVLRAVFDRAGLYVWHCHILEHEDNEMMRPYRVLPK